MASSLWIGLCYSSHGKAWKWFRLSFIDKWVYGQVVSNRGGDVSMALYGMTNLLHCRSECNRRGAIWQYLTCERRIQRLMNGALESIKTRTIEK